MATKALPKNQAKPAASPLTSMAEVLAPTQPVPVPAVLVAIPAVYAGLPTGQLTKSQLAFATAKHAPSMPKLGTPLTVVGAKTYKVRSGNNAAWWQAMLSAGCDKPAGATPAQLQAAVSAGTLCPKFLGYAVARRWVQAPAA